MTDDPLVREIGRLADDVGRVLIVGVDYDAVTLRTLHTRTSGAVALGMGQQEELGQLLIAAVWQAGGSGEDGRGADGWPPGGGGS